MALPWSSVSGGQLGRDISSGSAQEGGFGEGRPTLPPPRAPPGPRAPGGRNKMSRELRDNRGDGCTPASTPTLTPREEDPSLTPRGAASLNEYNNDEPAMPRKWRAHLSQDSRGHDCASLEALGDSMRMALRDLEERQRQRLDRQTERLLSALEGGRERKALEGSPMGKSPSNLDKIPGDSQSNKQVEEESPDKSAKINPTVVEAAMHLKREEAPKHVVGKRETISQGAVKSALKHGTYRWQWQSSAGPWKDYEPAANQSIEAAYLRGASRLCLKSGRASELHIEIFFVDMIQRDPESRKIRAIRREGPLSVKAKINRHVFAIARYLRSGKLPYESLDRYKTRQAALMGIEALEDGDDGEEFCVPVASLKRDFRATMSVRSKACRKSLVKKARKVSRTLWFTIVSTVMVLLQVWWIAYATDKNFGLFLYDQDLTSIIVEHAFCIYFLLELVLSFTALKNKRFWYLNTWISLDVVCVFFSVLDILLIPPIVLMLDVQTLHFGGGSPALRALRLIKLFRVTRIFGASQEFTSIMKGMVSGMRSAGYILAMLGMAVFSFGVVMNSNADDPHIQPYFKTLSTSMTTLLACGLFLDGIGPLIEDMVTAEAIVPGFLFFIFMWISFFGLLSMLVGAFCSVAQAVHSEEEDAQMLANMKANLEELLECYMDAGSKALTKKQFILLMKNADVHRELKRTKTDIGNVIEVANTVFETQQTLDVAFLLELMVHLRSGNIAEVRDIIRLQGLMLKGLTSIEKFIVGMQRKEGASTEYQVRGASKELAEAVLGMHNSHISPRNHNHNGVDTADSDRYLKRPSTGSLF